MMNLKKLLKEKPVKSVTSPANLVSSRKLKRLFDSYSDEIDFVLSVERERSVLILEKLLDTGIFTVEEFAQKLKEKTS